jgi:FkbM family methyltransferase
MHWINHMSQYHTIGSIYEFLKTVNDRGFSPRGIIDVGANRGDWTKLALNLFPKANILMIEPQSEMVAPLEQICREHPNVEFIQAGAGPSPGELIQTIWDDLAGSSFLPHATQEHLSSGKQRLTRIITIADEVQKRPHFHPDLVKLDIQGFEIEALKGATPLFGVTELFILETSLYEFLPRIPLTHDCFTFMRSKGYDFYDVTGFIRRPFDGALAQIDIAFAKAGGILRNTHRWS